MTAPPPALPEWTPLAASPGTMDPTVPLSAPAPLLVKGPRSSDEAAPLARSLRVSHDRTVLRRRLVYVRDHVLKRFELYAATMTIAFLGFASGLVWADAGASTTFVVAVVGMGAIQMSIQWAIRERERRLRAQAVAEIREMLRDRVLNQLAVVRIRTAGDPQCTDLQEDALDDVDHALGHIKRMVDELSESQLDTWRMTYVNVADDIAVPSLED